MAQQRCSNCGGTGQTPCWQCGGKGHNTCSGCNGRGRVGWGETESTCTSCGGSRQFNCHACSYGKAMCSACYGKGEVFVADAPSSLPAYTPPPVHTPPAYTAPAVHAPATDAFRHAGPARTGGLVPNQTGQATTSTRTGTGRPAAKNSSEVPGGNADQHATRPPVPKNGIGWFSKTIGILVLLAGMGFAAIFATPERIWRESVSPYARDKELRLSEQHLGGFSDIADWPTLARNAPPEARMWMDFKSDPSRQTSKFLENFERAKRPETWPRMEGWLQRQCKSGLEAACMDLAVALGSGYFGRHKLHLAAAALPTTGTMASSPKITALKKRIAEDCLSCSFWRRLDWNIGYKGNPAGI